MYFKVHNSSNYLPIKVGLAEKAKAWLAVSAE